MNTRKFFLSLLLLVTATFMSEVFAQSAEEAAKYGQLQEIQLQKAGQLGKFIKKADPNATALKISGELNEKDWAILFSLPNIAYLDLGEATNIAKEYEWKEGKERKRTYLGDYTTMMFSETLKYLVVEKNSKQLSFHKTRYNLDKLVVGCNFEFYFSQQYNMKSTSLKITNSGCKISNENKLKKNLYQPYGSSKYKWEYTNIVKHIGEERYIHDRAFHCDTLFLPTKYALSWYIIGFVDPKIVIVESPKKKIINNDISSSIIKDLSNTELEEGAFFDNKYLEHINLGNDVTKIPDCCFWGCTQLKNIDLTNITAIGSNAFSFSGIESIKWPLGAEEFDISCIEASSVKQVDLTNHNYPPILKGNITNDVINNVEFIIPKGTRKHYKKEGWEKLNYIEDGAEDTYTFQLDSIGTLPHLITDDICLNIKSLTLKGILDETEFDAIKKCKNLRYLDMRDCFTFESTEKAKERYLNEKGKIDAMNWLFSTAKQMNEQKYNNQEISTETAYQTHVQLEYLSLLLPKSMSVEDIEKVVGSGKIIYREECYLPEAAFAGLTQLETLILPQKLLWVKNIFGKEDPEKLKKVQFSNETKVIGDYVFADCKSLEEINIPDSLYFLGQSCFRNCAIKKVDLRNSKVQAWALDDRTYFDEVKSIGLPLNAFFDCPLQEFYSPINIIKPAGCEWLSNEQMKKLYGVTYNYYGDKRLKTNNANKVVLYFYFNEPFCDAEHVENIYGKIKELHIPRGQKAAWRGYPNLIDDIDL